MTIDITSRDGSLWYNNQRFRLKGINWFGFETSTFVVHGLWCNSMRFYLTLLARQGFNALRVPFCVQLALEPHTTPNGIDFSLNPDLHNMTSLDVLHVLMEDSAQLGILVLLDAHKMHSNAGISELWYDELCSEQQMTQAWSSMVKEFSRHWNFFGADLKNEPHGAASWGTGDVATDWRLAAQRLGNAILCVNPKLLIFVEGIERQQSAVGGWWGGDISAAKVHPITLNVPHKLVYSPHVYGPDVHLQPYFTSPEFPHNLRHIWEAQWSDPEFAHQGPCIVIGEWGGKARSDVDQVWHSTLAAYLKETGRTDNFYWCLNPNSGDTGGLLLDDWTTLDVFKAQLLDSVNECATLVNWKDEL